MTPGTGHLHAVAAPDAADEVILGSPPLDVQAEVAEAAARVDDLAARDRELHFTTDDDTGRIVVQIRDLRGNVITTIPPSQALDIMSGDIEL